MEAKLSGAIHGGSGIYLEPPKVHLHNGSIEVRVRARDGDISLGDGVVTMTPSIRTVPVGSFGQTQAELAFATCAGLDEGVGTEILTWFLPHSDPCS